MKLFCVSSEMSSVFTEGIEYFAEYTGGGCNVRSRYDSVFYAKYNDETGYFVAVPVLWVKSEFPVPATIRHVHTLALLR